MSLLRNNRFVLSIFAALILVAGHSQAAVSYFMLMGDFDESGSMQTYKWAVNYTSGTLLTGKDLMDAIFGVPVPGTGDDEGLSIASNGDFTVKTSGDYLLSFSYQGQELADNGFDESWWSYAALGSYSSTFQGETYEGDYGASWESAGSGFSGRSLVDGSFDGWIFTPYDPDTFVPMFPITGTPTAADFSGPDTIVVNIPEPGKGVLLILAGVCFVLRRKR